VRHQRRHAAARDLEIVTEVAKHVPTHLGITHNDTENAVANTLAAVRASAPRSGRSTAWGALRQRQFGLHHPDAAVEERVHQRFTTR
jgi:hypothetical protein